MCIKKGTITMSMLSRFGKRLSAEFSYWTGNEEAFAKKVIEVAAERISNKLDSAIKSTGKKPKKFSYYLMSLMGPMGFTSIGNPKHPVVASLLDEHISPLVAKAKANGIILTVHTKEPYDSGAHLADRPAIISGTMKAAI